MGENVMTPKFRVSFPDVFKPGRADDGGQSKYGVTMLFEKGADLSALKAEAQRAGIDKWGPDVTKWPKGWKSPFKNQGDKDYDGYVDGAICITAKSKQKPGLVNARNEDIIDESDFYAGCYARATVRAFAYENKMKGIAFGLQNIQKLADGEPFSGRVKAQEDFEPVEPADSETVGSGAGKASASDLFG